MARIKIEDLPKDMKISKEELRNVMGGAGYLRTSVLPYGVDLEKGSPVELYGGVTWKSRVAGFYGGVELYMG